MKKSSGYCNSSNLGNCNICQVKPISQKEMFFQLSKKYVRDLDFTYKKSFFTIKPILAESEVDDSRPTIIRQNSIKPEFISVFSGKFNTIYDLEEYL
jgi:hypothetical protein